MAKSNFTRLFSNSGLLSWGMKSTMLVLLLVLVGCGGIKPPVGDPTPRATPVPTPIPSPTPTPTPITAAQVFSNIAETWAFVSHCANLQQDGTRGPIVEAHTWIEVNPQPDGSSIWHFTKDQPCAYWAPDVVQAELYFFLSKDETGTWYSTGGRIIMPFGCPWCTPTPTSPVDLTYAEFSVPGHPRPYLILGDSGTSVDTFYSDGPINVRWITKMYVQDGFLISEQWEGNALHADGTPCGHEKWWGKPGRGLWKIEVLDQGSCVDVDPRLNIERIN